MKIFKITVVLQNIINKIILFLKILVKSIIYYNILSYPHAGALSKNLTSQFFGTWGVSLIR